MRLIVLLAAASATLVGCASAPEKPEQEPREAPMAAMDEKPAAQPKQPAAAPGPEDVSTARIIEILKNEDVAFVFTTHSQHITIRLKDGKQYEGTYVASEAGEYSDTTDILNLVLRIQKERPELKNVAIACE